MNAIDLSGLSKRFGGGAMVLDDVSLQVAPGRIFGIVGRSGAGKSTLIRCINLLERPDSGRVCLFGEPLLDKNTGDLRRARRDIGMVCQHFNLMSSRTVAGNVAFPLEIAGVPARDRTARVAELLALVGLTARAQAYPAQLSGGQKQRVGIARALASRPRVLLCDEATSALDPETTTEILGLLRELRDALDLTAVLVTHEMAVVKTLCDEVAVMDGGRIVEQGRVAEVFIRPSHPTTRRFVAETIGHDVPAVTRSRMPPPEAGQERRLLRVLFTGRASMGPAISQASRRFDLDFNILSGRIDEIAGEPFGVMVVAAYGPPQRLDAARAWLVGQGVAVDDLEPAAGRA